MCSNLRGKNRAEQHWARPPVLFKLALSPHSERQSRARSQRDPLSVFPPAPPRTTDFLLDRHSPRPRQSSHELTGYQIESVPRNNAMQLDWKISLRNTDSCRKKRAALGYSEPLELRTLPSVIPLGPQTLVNSYMSLRQWAPAIASDADGDFVVVWASTHDTEPSFRSIRGQRYSSNGAKLGTDFM